MTVAIDVVLIVLGVAIAAAVMTAAVRSGRPVRALAESAMQGLCALGAVDLIGMFTSVSLGLGLFNIAVCAVLGLPGTVTLLLLQAIMTA